MGAKLAKQILLANMQASCHFAGMSDPIGPKIRALRLEQRLSLAELASATGVSEATMSRIETGHSAVSAPHLYALARRLGTDIGQFFSDGTATLRQGARSVTRAGEGAAFTTARLSARLLNGDLRHKAMHSFVNRTSATQLQDVGGLLAHEGEEHLFVLRGPLILCTDGYEPLRLDTGDSVYFDAAQPHAYLTLPGQEAEFLVTSSTDAPHPLTKDAPDAE